MVRGTFANVRIKNLMVPGVEGGVTMHQPSGERVSIYDAAMKYQGARAVDRACGPGVWNRKFTRLGRKGHAAARRESSNRPEF